MQFQLVKKILNRTTTAIFPLHRLLSTSVPAPSEKPSQFAVEYLINSCGLPREKAIKASSCISYLKSPVKPDSILQFLRQSGLSDSDITRAVTPNPRLLCVNLEKIMKPRITELQEMGLSPSQIAQFVSLCPGILRFIAGESLQRRIQFWTTYLGSLEGIFSVLKKSPYLLTISVEKVVEPNISFLEGHCTVSPDQIRKVIMRSPSMVTINSKKLKDAAERAEELGSSRGSGMFIYALQVTLGWGHLMWMPRSVI